ncbi:MAG TPA: hypothetical protein VF681_15865 [Abditibacteriaceae bacterium]|jgi:TolA-binding protein
MARTETSLLSNSRTVRRSRTAALFAVFALLLLLTLRVLLTPDPAGALLFARAQRLETAGLMRPALRHYQLLAQTHAASPYAPQALMREAALWLQFARGGETTAFAEAVKTYQRVARTYRQTGFAPQALLAIGAISLSELGDEEAARAAYEQALKEYPNNREAAAESTLRLGRVAQAMRDGKTAQRWYQTTLKKFAPDEARCAEAQYALGETYENLWRNRDWARNAYETTLRSYPKTVWAGKAKERLGLMLYHEAAPRARRVLLQVPAIPSEDDADDLLAGVRMVLAARGIDASGTTLRGWSLAPFYAGYFPDDPGRVARISLASWKTVATNAGLRFRISDGGDARGALQMLQSELDAAHLSLVYSGARRPRWQLVTGYDSGRDSVWLQRGAELLNPSSSDFAKAWNRRSELGGAFSLVSFEAPGESSTKPKLAPISTVPSNDSVPPPAPERAAPKLNYAKITAQQSPLSAPTYFFELKPLDERAAHRRALRRAAQWLRRPRDESSGALLGGEALRSIATILRRYAADDSATANGNAANMEGALPEANAVDEPLAREEGLPDSAMGQPTPTPAGDSLPKSQALSSDLEPLRALLAWRNAPLSRWLDARRDAAAYCDAAGGRLRENAPRRAARALREAISALEDARSLLPSPNALGRELSPTTRRSLANAAAKLDTAREAEARAIAALESFG